MSARWVLRRLYPWKFNKISRAKPIKREGEKQEDKKPIKQKGKKLIKQERQAGKQARKPSKKGKRERQATKNL